MPITQPISRGFNEAVHTIAARLFPTGFDVADAAPATLEALQAHVAHTGRMIVWNGASDNTIFACPATNWAFRAWHDWTHNKYSFPFTDEGERGACEKQKAQVLAVYGPGALTDLFCNLLEIEVMGQLAFKNEFGYFPEDQMGFALDLGTAL